MRTSGLVLAASAMTAGLATRVSPTHRLVPAAGLSPEQIHWAVDRRARHHSSSAALDASDWTLTAAVAFPLLLGATADESEGGRRWISGATRRLALYAEASIWTDAVTTLLKRSVGRPRPTLYRAQTEGQVQADSWSVASFPSGHATRAGCAAAVGVLERVRARPEASHRSHFVTGLVGGALAATTAALRVEGGVHFPSDAAGGVAIGGACGAGVSLLHRTVPSTGRHPPRSAWIAATGGMLTGGLVASALASVLGPS